jgi:hypothetical protein
MKFKILANLITLPEGIKTQFWTHSDILRLILPLNRVAWFPDEASLNLKKGQVKLSNRVLGPQVGHHFL